MKTENFKKNPVFWGLWLINLLLDDWIYFKFGWHTDTNLTGLVWIDHLWLAGFASAILGTALCTWAGIRAFQKEGRKKEANGFWLFALMEIGGLCFPYNPNASSWFFNDLHVWICTAGIVWFVFLWIWPLFTPVPRSKGFNDKIWRVLISTGLCLVIFAFAGKINMACELLFLLLIPVAEL